MTHTILEVSEGHAYRYEPSCLSLSNTIKYVQGQKKSHYRE
jgi:hypothetical protein